MPRLKSANLAKSRLARDIDQYQNFMYVVDSSKFPEPPFRVVVNNEIIEVGGLNREANIFTNLQRGLEGTTASFHAAGSFVENVFTAGVYEELADQEDIQQLTEEFNEHLNETTIQTSEIVTVGPGGDFTSINQAIEYFSKKYPKFVQGNMSNQIKGEIRLKTGFVMQEEVHVFGLNLGWIVITSEDAEVTIDRSAIVTEIATNYKGAFVVIRGVGPTIGTLFTMDTTGSPNNQSGIIAWDNARITVLPGCGLKNATLHGMVASRCSHINAELAIATGAGGYGVYAYQLGRINFNVGNARRLPDQDTNQDYVVATGGMIKKGIGGTNIPVNELTLQGIIF